MSVLFCFGLGYTAGFLARRLKAEGWEVRGTTRDRARLAGLEDAGFLPFLFGRDRPLDHPAKALAGVTHVLHSVPPDPEGDPVLDRHGDDLRALGDGLAWVGYLGTTAVYGDRGGDWVGEDDAPAPTLERARRRAAAEAAWRASGLPVHVFRLAGIYGPGRSALDNLKDGTARRIVKPGQVFSRIHVEDIATVLEASIARPNPGRVYNVCDDEAAPPQDVVAYAADLLGVAPPPERPYATADLSPMARTFYKDNRRVRNDRIKAELGVRLLFPTYREGLMALRAEMAR
ncbi:MAG: SDR family oxidoreductase [Geminicoccaceae bacterium]|nr:SDR family oxidoreductase [Geminicoccaceae bacterium]